MTEKIIIDGIDVSGCGFYQRVFEKPDRHDPCNQWGDTKLIFCSENPNCDYKQKHRLEAQYNQVVEQNKSLQVELKQKEQECERMRGALIKIRDYELQSLDIDWDEYETCCRETEYSPIIDYCEIGLGEVEDENDCSCKELHSFKQALDEIENFMIYEFSGQNEWVKTSVLDIINKVKEVYNEDT